MQGDCIAATLKITSSQAWNAVVAAGAHQECGCMDLQVAVGKDRVLPIASFRGGTRPVLLAGSRAWLTKAMEAAEPYRCSLYKDATAGNQVVP